ncbi:heavy metal-associated domain-containing protein [Streptosporangium canum]|uniref:heavy-metal-associated domain-containing protein n=1 Tax=Streptosporangium canum TaxID=324952 RepID=UPI00343327A4
MSTSTYTVAGMTCNGCANKVKTAVTDAAGASAVNIDLATGKVTVTADRPIDDVAITNAVEEIGYEVTVG